MPGYDLIRHHRLDGGLADQRSPCGRSRLAASPSIRRLQRWFVRGGHQSSVVVVVVVFLFVGSTAVLLFLPGSRRAAARVLVALTNGSLTAAGRGDRFDVAGGQRRHAPRAVGCTNGDRVSSQPRRALWIRGAKPARDDHCPHGARKYHTGDERNSSSHRLDSPADFVMGHKLPLFHEREIGWRLESANVLVSAFRDNGGMHLLLVEDEKRLATAVRRVLEEEGHVVDWVDDGADALAQAQTEEYDLVLLDVMLPSLDGYEVARRLRAKSNTVPILMLTARDGVSDRVQGLDSGADDYLVKPFALAELLARVRALTRRAKMLPGDSSVLKVSDLELDLKTREAIRGGKRIELTAKEFALLEVMMRHPGQVMTRSQLLDRIWSYDVLTESNIVDIYIHYLRNKIDRDFDEKLIRTVRGVGYALRSG